MLFWDARGEDILFLHALHAIPSQPCMMSSVGSSCNGAQGRHPSPTVMMSAAQMYSRSLLKLWTKLSRASERHILQLDNFCHPDHPADLTSSSQPDMLRALLVAELDQIALGY